MFKYRALNDYYIKYYINQNLYKMIKRTDKKFFDKYTAERFIFNS